MRTITLIIVTGLMQFGATARPDEPRLAPPITMVADDCIIGIKSYEEFRLRMARLDSAQEVARIFVADGLLDIVTNNRTWQAGWTVTGTRAANEPNLANMQETAAWVLDHLLAKSGGEKDDSSETRLSKWKKEAAKRHALTEVQRNELREKFAGRIQLGEVRLSDPQFRMLYELLAAWFPYGKSPEELFGLLGIRPGMPGCKIEAGHVLLTGSDEMFSFEIKLTCKNGLIESVRFAFGS